MFFHHRICFYSADSCANRFFHSNCKVSVFVLVVPTDQYLHRLFFFGGAAGLQTQQHLLGCRRARSPMGQFVARGGIKNIAWECCAHRVR